MRVDRARFLELTFLLSATVVGCEDRARGPAVVPVAPGPAPLVIPPLAETAASASPPPEVEPPRPPERACPETPADLSVCHKISPTCEGMIEECTTLDQSFHPRVAEAIAQCMTKARAPQCRPKSLGVCMRKAIESACVEPDAVLACKEVMQACRDAGKPPKYTAEQCAAIVSAAPRVFGARMGSEAWSNEMLETLGPTNERGSCALDWVLAYQPWGASWK